MSREIYRKPVAEQCLLWEVNRFTPDKETERGTERERERERSTWKFTLHVEFCLSFLVSLQEIQCAFNWIGTFVLDNVTRQPPHPVMDTIEWGTSRRKIEVETSRQAIRNRDIARCHPSRYLSRGRGKISLKSFPRTDYHGDLTRNWN